MIHIFYYFRCSHYYLVVLILSLSFNVLTFYDCFSSKYKWFLIKKSENNNNKKNLTKTCKETFPLSKLTTYKFQFLAYFFQVDVIVELWQWFFCFVPGTCCWILRCCPWCSVTLQTPGKNIHKLYFLWQTLLSCNLFIYQARQSLAWSQQGFWCPSFCRKRTLGSLCFDWGNWAVILFNASLKERGSIMKLKGWKVDLFPLLFVSIAAMQRNFTLGLPSKQSLHKLCFLQKLGCLKPCWDQARLCLAW